MRELPVDASRSLVVGDSWRDVLAARAAGLPSIGVRGGEGFDGPEGPTLPNLLVDDFGGAVGMFLAAGWSAEAVRDSRPEPSVAAVPLGETAP